MSQLKQDITRKGQVDEATSQLEFEDRNGSDSGVYEVEAIRNSVIYARDSEGHSSGL